MEENKNGLQEELLKKLTEYGDSILETRFTSRKKKKRKLNPAKEVKNSTLNEHSSEIVDSANLNNEEPRKKKRKKKKKNRENGDNIDAVKTNTNGEENLSENKTTLVGPRKHVDSIVGELGLKQFKSDLQKLETSMLNGETKRKNAGKGELEVIVFTSRKERKQKINQRPLAIQKADAAQDFDIKQARFEVRKFGLAGFQGDEKEKAMTDLLLSLGAKPKKKTYINYKELLEKRREEIMLEADKREQDRQQGLKVGKKKNSKRSRDKNDVGTLDGQVGKFKHGVQFIKPNDVQGIKKSKLKAN